MFIHICILCVLLHDTDPKTGTDLRYDAYAFLQKSAYHSSQMMSAYLRVAQSLHLTQTLVTSVGFQQHTNLV